MGNTSRQKVNDKPHIVIGDNSEVEFFCNICGRKLIDLKDGVTYQYGNCVINFKPQEQDVRRSLGIETLDGPVSASGSLTGKETFVATVASPTVELRKKQEIKGGLKSLSEKGTINVTSYSETVG